MKFKDILMRVNEHVRIRIRVMVFGMNFSTEHSAEYYFNSEDTELREKEVVNIYAADDVLELVLK